MSSGRLILPVAEPCISNQNVLQSGATMTVYIAGGGTLAALYADAGLSTSILNPQTSDAAGRFFDQTTEIWADATQAYDVDLAFPDGETFTFGDVYLLGAQANVSGFAPLNSPAFTGVPTAPTPGLSDNSQKIATTGFVQGQDYAPLASPALTGTPTAPTAGAGTNTTQLATTAFVTAALGVTIPVTATNAAIKIGGLIIQSVSFSLGASLGATQTVNWPIPFTTRVYGTPWVASNGAASEMIGVTPFGLTTATVVKGNGDSSARTGTVWAIGV